MTNTATTKNLPAIEMLNTFGCSHMEHEILEVINLALANGQLPDFTRYNLEETNCECRTDVCCWNEAEILKRLKECGVWEKVEKLLAADIPAHCNPDGTITVEGHNICFPFAGEYDNYREMDADAERLIRDAHPNGYVCHVTKDDSDKCVLMLPAGSKYIALVD